MNARKDVIHAIGECKGCAWREEDYRTAQAKAQEHAQTTGHHVLLEIGYFVEYNAKPEMKV